METKKLSPAERVYYAFYSSKKKRLYFNEMRASLKMSISSLQNALKKLEKNREIEKNKEKGNVFYSLKNKEIKALNFAKFDIQRIENLNINVKIPIKEFLEKTRNVAFILLFGSSSRKEEKRGSDIDLLIVTYYFEDKKLNEIYQKEIRKKIEEIKKIVNAKSLYLLSIAFVDENEFSTRKDYMLDEAKKTWICVYNQTDYYLKNEN